MRGSQGGYTLTRNPDQITVGDIIRIMEGPIAPVDCLLTDAVDNEYCSRAATCVSRGVWARVRDSINAVLDSTSLADLAREKK